MKYKPAIGLEIHARLFSEKKMFCNCENSFGGEPNTRVCSVCKGVSGTLPVLNKEAVRLGIKAGLVLGCNINNESSFDRKHYISPDLPKGYQITQQFKPLCENGGFEVNDRIRRINNIHLEEDAAKVVYLEEKALIDFNRCGTPLIEIVTEPDFESSEDVAAFVEELALRLRFCDVCDGRIEQGSLRVDVNISVASEDAAVLGTRCEIKNIGSIKSLKRAIEYEIKRQTEVLESGGSIACETRRFCEENGKTEFMRMKESVSDYRYCAETDVPELFVSDTEISELKKSLPQLPKDRVQNYISNFGLTGEEAWIIVSDKCYADWFETACSNCTFPKKVSSLMLVGLNRLFNKYGGTLFETKVSPCMISSLAELWGSGKVSSDGAFEILEEMFKNGGDPEEIAKSAGLIISFDGELAKLEINKILFENEKNVLEYKSGNKKIFGFLMGKVIGRLGKSTDPASVKKLLEECIEVF